MMLTAIPGLEDKKEFFHVAQKAEEDFEISKNSFEDKIYQSMVFTFYLHFFTKYQNKITKPIKLILEKGKHSDSFIVSNEELNKYGIGLTKEEAIEDFEESLVEDFRILSNSKSNDLTEDAKEKLTLYKSYLET